MGYSMKTKMGRAALVVGLLGMVAWGCGGDDDDDDDGSGGSAGSTAGMSGAGAGGMAGGTAGTRAGTGGAAAGTGGSMATVTCNGVVCPRVMLSTMMAPACCDMDNGGVCGAAYDAMNPMACEATKQEGMPDPTCPSAMSVLQTPLMGCCKMGNKCGVMSASLMGCVERTDYPTQFLAMGTGPLQAVNCGGSIMDGGSE